MTRAVFEAFGMTSKRLVGDPPHDEVVEHRGVRFVEQVLVLGAAGPDLVEVVGQVRLQQLEGSRDLRPARCRGG